MFGQSILGLEICRNKKAALGLTLGPSPCAEHHHPRCHDASPAREKHRWRHGPVPGRRPARALRLPPRLGESAAAAGSGWQGGARRQVDGSKGRGQGAGGGGGVWLLWTGHRVLQLSHDPVTFASFSLLPPFFGATCLDCLKGNNKRAPKPTLGFPFLRQAKVLRVARLSFRQNYWQEHGGPDPNLSMLSWGKSRTFPVSHTD